MQVIVKFNDQALGQFRTKLAGLAERGPSTMAQAMNAAGQTMHQATIAAETAQTGLTHGTMERAQRVHEASSSRLVFTINSSGGNVRLKYFGAKEGGGGVTAHPWAQSHFYRSAFMTSGRQGMRKPMAKLGGQVYEPKDLSDRYWWRQIKSRRSGLYIPTEMTKGSTKAAFEAHTGPMMSGIMTNLAGLMP